MNHSHINPYILDWFLDKSEERHFDTAIDVAVGTALHFAADARRYSQVTTLGWAQSYFTWADRVLQKDPMYTEHSDEAEFVAKLLVVVGVPLSYLPFAVVTASPYLGPWALVTAPVAFALDAYNIYRYFD